jgi:hypothetical protein
MDRISFGEAHHYQVTLSDVRIIMVIMHVTVVELLCQVSMRQILVLVGACGHVLLCQVLNATAS